MQTTETLSNTQQQAAEANVAQILEDQAKITASPNHYENSAVSASASVGPDGANMEGNIHYTRGGQVYFSKLEVTDFWGAGGGVGGGILIGSLSADRLAGKTGTFEVRGGLGGGTLQMWVDGQPVFTRPLDLVGGGTPWGWGAKGKVKFDRVS